MRRPLVAVALSALAFLLLAAVLFDRPLLEKRTRIAAVGTPPPVLNTSPIVVPPGGRMCMTRILLSPRTEIAELIVDQGKRPTPALDVVAEGPGYRSPVVTVPAGPEGRHVVTARIEPPDRDLIGQLCVRARERRPVTFVGTVEFRTITRAETTIDGNRTDVDAALTFYDPEKVSALGELGGIVDRMTISRGFLGASWFAWILLVLAAMGVPAAVFSLLARMLREPR